MRWMCFGADEYVPELKSGQIYEGSEEFTRNEPCEYCNGRYAVRLEGMEDGPNCGVFCRGYLRSEKEWTLLRQRQFPIQAGSIDWKNIPINRYDTPGPSRLVGPALIELYTKLGGAPTVHLPISEEGGSLNWSDSPIRTGPSQSFLAVRLDQSFPTGLSPSVERRVEKYLRDFIRTEENKRSQESPYSISEIMRSLYSPKEKK